jgi:hypothetical protein
MIGCPTTIAVWWWLERDDSGPYMGMGLLFLSLVAASGLFSLAWAIAAVAARRAN